MNLLQQLLEMSLYKAQDIEHDITKKFLKLDIILRFSNHFTDRLVSTELDKNNKVRDNISEEEFIETFDKLEKHHKVLFREVADHQDEVKRGMFEGVIQETFKNINVPFALVYDQRQNKFILTCKTIMKKEKGKFHTQSKDHVIKV